MSNISSSKVYIQSEECDYRSAVSEALLTKIGGSVNWALDQATTNASNISSQTNIVAGATMGRSSGTIAAADQPTVTKDASSQSIMAGNVLTLLFSVDINLSDSASWTSHGITIDPRWNGSSFFSTPISFTISSIGSSGVDATIVFTKSYTGGFTEVAARTTSNNCTISSLVTGTLSTSTKTTTYNDYGGAAYTVTTAIPGGGEYMTIIASWAPYIDV